MKKSKALVVMSLVLALIMMLFSQSFAFTSKSSSNSNFVPFKAYSKTVTLTFARVMNRGNQLAKGETTSKNVMIDIIKQKLNVACKVAWETSPDQYNNRLALSIAGGTLPDVFLINSDNYLTFRALVDNGALADMTKAYNTCIGGLAAEWLKTYKGKQLTAATVNGKIMAIPCPSSRIQLQPPLGT